MTHCQVCDRFFNSQSAFWQHCDNSARHRCQVCTFHYTDFNDEDEHMLQQHVQCGVCGLWVFNQDDMHGHNSASHADRYCVDCRRMFMAPSNYNAHRNSLIHTPKGIPCPHRARGCNAMFVSHSAMTLHLESGHCVSGMTRADVNQRVLELDRGRVITDPSRLLTNGARATYQATDRAFNGHAWECYLCHAQMRSVQALNNHLNSPRHEEKIYLCVNHCPQPQCKQRFVTLSGLMQHIESDRCGVQRFRVVQIAISQLTSGMRSIGY
ncbi:hypothetical protein AURDEDRAFT_139010 [Auricularia subglabra TFB-10046 SS5]|nr:hypothetical protein AURDEDRAFT_139010 [Auricularia subglabra TFB-10046 SS5]